jgi:AcrR family transcriptional regulator
VATVYRHFETKQALVAGLRDHYQSIANASPSDWSAGKFGSIEQVLQELPKAAARISRIEPALRAAVASGVVDEFRREHRAERLEPIETALRRERPDLAPADLQKLRDVIAVLCSSLGLRAFEILTGASPEETGETVAWAIRRLLGGLA